MHPFQVAVRSCSELQGKEGSAVRDGLDCWSGDQRHLLAGFLKSQFWVVFFLGFPAKPAGVKARTVCRFENQINYFENTCSI